MENKKISSLKIKMRIEIRENVICSNIFHLSCFQCKITPIHLCYYYFVWITNNEIIGLWNWSIRVEMYSGISQFNNENKDEQNHQDINMFFSGMLNYKTLSVIVCR